MGQIGQTMNELTETQAKLHAYLCERWNDPPSVREIGKHFGWLSPNGVMCHLRALESKGFIELPAGKRSRGIRLLICTDLSGTEIEIAGRLYVLIKAAHVRREENHARSNS